MRPRSSVLVLSVLPAVIPLASSIAQAGPSHAAIDTRAHSAPLVGRLRTRVGMFDLTRSTIASDGPAGHLAPSVAGVMAEASQASPTSAESGAEAERGPRR